MIFVDILASNKLRKMNSELNNSINEQNKVLLEINKLLSKEHEATVKCIKKLTLKANKINAVKELHKSRNKIARQAMKYKELAERYKSEIEEIKSLDLK